MGYIAQNKDRRADNVDFLGNQLVPGSSPGRLTNVYASRRGVVSLITTPPTPRLLVTGEAVTDIVGVRRLVSADQIMRLHHEKVRKVARPRARQSVVFELDISLDDWEKRGVLIYSRCEKRSTEWLPLPLIRVEPQTMPGTSI
jgi:hypothetical protein